MNSPRNNLENDLGARDALIQQLREQSSEALELAQQSFDGDTKATGALCDMLSQLQRVADLAGLPGVAALASAAAEVATGADERAREALAEGLVTLNSRLQVLRSGDPAPLAAYLEEINRLRAAHGAAPMGDEASFIAALRSGAPYATPSPIAEQGAPPSQRVAEKLREPAQRIFAALRREPVAEAVYDALSKLVSTMDRAARTVEEREPWWLAGVLLAGRRDKTVAGEGLPAFLAGLESVIAAMAEGKPVPEEWSYQAVYRLRDVAAIRAVYGLGAAAQPAASGQSGVAVEALSKAAQAELVRVRNAFDVYLRSGASDAELLAPAAASLESVIATLRVAGLSRAADLLEDAQVALSALVDGQPLGPAANMIADTLLHADEMLVSGRDGPAVKLRRESLAALVDAALQILTEVHEAIVAANELGEKSGVDSYPERMVSVAGALKVAGLDDAAQIARQAADVLKTASRGGQSLDSLAEALICFELYLGAIRKGAPNDNELVKRARSALSGAVAAASEATPEEDEPAVVSPSADPDLLAIYIDEAAEQLQAVIPEFLELRNHPDDRERRVSVQRFFHTLKGSGRMVGAPRIAEFCWAFEQLIASANERDQALAPPVMELLGAALVATRQLHEELASGAQPVVAIAALRSAASDPAQIPPGMGRGAVAAVAQASGDLVRRWLDAVRDGKSSGRVPPAIFTALEALRETAQLLGNEDVVGAAGDLHERMQATFELDKDGVTTFYADLDRLAGLTQPAVAGGRVDASTAEAYRDEVRALLEHMGEAVDAMLLDAGDADAVLTIQRDLHTLKGTTRVAGFRELPEFTHELEAVVQAVAQERMTVTPRLLWMLQRVLDAMFGMLDDDTPDVASAHARKVLQELRLASGDSESMMPLPAGAERRRKPRVSIESERVRADQLDRALVHALSLGLKASQFDSGMREQTMWNVAAISEILRTLTADVRVIRDALIRSRQAPVHMHANRWRRVVRQAAEDSGREVELRFDGSDTELDRRLLDGLVGPFEHLLRNAVVHGVESPFARRAAGKPPQGTVVIRTVLESDGVMVEIEDNGAGMDPEKIRRAAKERGLAVPDGRLGPDALLKIVATPGFSTAAQVTQSAGYGIGLDSVLATVRDLGGSVKLVTETGVGTKFIINVPNPSPVMPVELYQVGAALIAVPPGAVVAARSIESGAPAVEHDGETWPWLDMAAAVGAAGARAGDDASIAVLLRHGSRGAAIRVSAALGKVEAAVHRLRPGELGDAQYVAGVGLLDGGRLATVLNVDAALASFPDALHVRPMALVADDSPTARDEVVRKLEKSGWRVVAVEDGVSARQHLVKARPGVIVLDIDMPGLNGLEVLRWIREQRALADTPVIMASSALDDARREEAAALGALACLDKPFKGSGFDDALASVTPSG